MRLLAGVLAATPIAATLIGDESLSRRPMERVAEPLRAMGATVRTDEGRAPLEVKGGRLHGIEYVTPVPSAQLKGAILLAACAAEGSTEVREPVATRDHTERALAALGGPVERAELGIRIGPFQHAGFHASLPGDASAAAFLVGGAAVTGGTVRIVDVGLNPTRIAFLDVLVRMGAKVEARQRRVELGEPVGDLVATGPERPRATTVEAAELPLLIDEVPLLAAVAAHADGPTRFIGAGELRVKESDRLNGMATALRAVGASADVEGDDLVVSGGGVGGGSASSGGDHRIAMALTVAGLAARETVVVEGADAADVSFPRFADALRAVGARVDPES
jgi:3-phosphoshikimate 1-carboxyvinyltransferase